MNVTNTCPFPEYPTIPAGVANIMLGFLSKRERCGLLRASKLWSVIVINYNANEELMTQLIKGNEKLMINHLSSNLQNLLPHYTRVMEFIRLETIRTQMRTFEVSEVKWLLGSETLADYHEVRRIEYQFCDEVISEISTRLKYKFSSPPRFTSSTETASYIAEHFLTALCEERFFAASNVALTVDQKAKIIAFILNRFTPDLSKALKKDGSEKWLSKLEDLRKVAFSTELGRKISATEKQWHLDIQDCVYSSRLWNPK